MNRWIKVLVTVVVTGSILAGCGGPNVSRIKPDETRDLSGMWNDTDSRLVSEEMIKDALARPWYSRFERTNRRIPAVIVGTVRNLSHEHINVNTFIGDMERSLINSGMVEFVASRNEREEIREERKDQDVHARADTRSAMGQELGADYMLKGTINTIIDTDGRSQVRYYQVDLTMISLKDNRKVWVGQKKIKKFIKEGRVRY
ncbi:MAG: penicillin-binding protein activator LpoB [Gammaproteobacteria bacterium]|nr:penicillin-binding protein activator LpoB [Gammaproteobacteria bacterium]